MKPSTSDRLLRKAERLRIFNTLGRVVGIGFIFIGSIIAISGATQKDWLIAGAGLTTCILGILLLLAKPSGMGEDNAKS
jgi:hypothetical protein